LLISLLGLLLVVAAGEGVYPGKRRRSWRISTGNPKPALHLGAANTQTHG
jgi:hypothetical protein